MEGKNQPIQGISEGLHRGSERTSWLDFSHYNCCDRYARESEQTWPLSDDIKSCFGMNTANGEDKGIHHEVTILSMILSGEIVERYDQGEMNHQNLEMNGGLSLQAVVQDCQEVDTKYMSIDKQQDMSGLSIILLIRPIVIVIELCKPCDNN